MKVEKTHFPTRRSRAIYIAERFRQYLHGDILDVGCDEAHLKTLMPHLNYTGIDIAGKPDIQLNLEKIEKLPFPDKSFDCVLCSDVLEHIDNLHQIFKELLRVSRHYVIISLPNNWSSARLPLARGKGEFAHYGLPIEPVMDRHKWFFNLCDIVNFMEGNAKKFSFDIVEMFATDKPRSLLSQMMKRINYPSQKKYLNRYSNTLWTVIEKK